ncbi:MAG TPA: hypothetical protein PKK10_11995 [Woeseiaceae bacterium]|nr:hypothetical protein [Woeseiaceae bacterium]
MKSKLYLLLFLSFTVNAYGDESTAPATAAQPDKELAEPAPKASTWLSEHSIHIGGKKIDYTATAGTMLMKNADDKPIALIGYTAYVARGENSNARPIMFAYNGGPGSASLWLHMGILGPQRVVLDDEKTTPTAPYRYVTNEYGILDQADLVMIDPVGTGFAKAVGEGKGEDFWGVDQDIKSVSDFIVQYLTENGRWASPKYVLGESYGGIRTGGVAYELLTKHMVALNGVILVSPFMEMATGFAGMGIDLPHVMFLPTYAATARYHGLLQPQPPNLEDFLQEVREFALDEYASALLAGDTLPDSKRRELLSKLARYTGLSEDYWDRGNLRISEGQFDQELMRKSGMTVGRIDSRFAGKIINPLGEAMVYDPMTSLIGPPTLGAFMDYYRNDLGVKSPDNYVVFGDVFAKWDWGHAQPDQNGFKLPFPNTTVDLAYTMKQNPSMRVLVLQGYYDLATPFLATEYYLDHMYLPEALKQNIELEYYEAGHMMYVHPPSMSKFRADLARFVSPN